MALCVTKEEITQSDTEVKQRDIEMKKNNSI